MTLSKRDEQEILGHFRAGLIGRDLIHDGDTIGTDDYTLLRFLRARQFDVNAATSMWESTQRWRSTVSGVGIDVIYRQVDTFEYSERKEVANYWPMYWHRTDKLGRPINFSHYEKLDMPSIYKHITPERFWHYVVNFLESMPREVLPAASRAFGRPVPGALIVLDMKGFGLSQFWQVKTIVRDAFQIMQDYYPEVMSKMLIVNAPPSFTYIWSIVKLWLSRETIEKIEILGPDYQVVLLEYVDVENIPERLGGTCACEDIPGGCAWIGREQFSS